MGIVELLRGRSLITFQFSHTSVIGEMVRIVETYIQEVLDQPHASSLRELWHFSREVFLLCSNSTR